MSLLDLFFPKICVGCGRWGSYLCPECVLNIKQSNLVCPVCERAAVGGVTHPLCRGKWKMDGLWSLGIYEGVLRHIIQKLKYRWVKEAADNLINLLTEYWARYNPAFLDEIKKDYGKDWVIVPVPLYWQRQNWRGFNQSASLGKILSKKLGLEYQEVLKRTRNTKTQVGMDARSRRHNIFNAFRLSKHYSLNANVLLIDDVWTTGSTLKECCYVLKRSGARKVWAITIAR